MALTQLKSPQAAARWLESWVRGTLRTDSRLVQPGDAFIAWPGHQTDGRQFVNDALRAGATTCLVEHDGVEAFGFDDARIATLPALKAVTGAIAHDYFQQPSGQLDVVATTGTNGKTSTAWWTAQALTLLGRRCGVVGTLGVGLPPLPGDPGAIHFTGLTTPDPVTLHAAFRKFADTGTKACTLEASSIGLVEHRLDGAQIDVALYTNFTRDHLDFHGTMQAYWAAKRSLFAWPGLRAASIYVDDIHGAALAAELQVGALDLWTVSITVPARLKAKNVRYIDGGLAFDAVEHDQTIPVRSTLIGDYNVGNLLVVLGGLRALGVSLAAAAGVVPQLTSVPGRMQRVGSGPLEVVVDYAHTPDALDKVLQALRQLTTARGGQLWCVFGCGGDRDPGKRAPMGAIAQARADRVIITSDNPRHENPSAIVTMIEAGLGKQGAHAHVHTVLDRRSAIHEAIRNAAPFDVVLIAGKGHEDYQDIAGVKHPFSDADEVLTSLRERSA